jgi:ankyrin repeat protein
MSDVRLIEAVKSGNVAMVAEEIELGGDINQQDDYGWTSLNWAAGSGDLKIVKLLLDHGADVQNIGRDHRTPCDIALAAGHTEIVKLLKQAENKLGEEKIERPAREYCRAYYLRDLRRFSDFSDKVMEALGGGDPDNGNGYEDHNKPLSDDDIAFLHGDFTVTKSMWRNENIIFDRITPEWRAFCAGVLKFEVPADIDLIVQAQAYPDRVS